ncbi:MAG: alpha/beta hydrolase family protein [Thermoproteota archaeon]
MKKPTLFFNEGMKISGILSEVEGSEDIVIFFHGFTGDKNEANNLFVEAENYFNREGISTFRFDFRFSKTNSNKSESEGTIDEMLPSAWISDGLFVTRKIKQLFSKKKIHLVGLSMGGLVGIHVAVNEKVNSLILWSAVVDSESLLDGSKEWIKSIMPKNYEAFVADFARNNPVKLYNKLTNTPIFIVAGEKDITVPVSQAEMFHKLLENSKLVVIPEADHVFSTKKNELFEATLGWIKSL